MNESRDGDGRFGVNAVQVVTCTSEGVTGGVATDIHKESDARWAGSRLAGAKRWVGR